MPDPTMLDYFPLWAIFLGTLALILAVAEAGYRIGIYRRRKADTEKEGPTGATIAATLGLLAFMLAFTFGLAAARHDSRREVFQDEVNAIGTAYLRTYLLPDEHGPKLRGLLREYVDVRLKVYESGADVGDLIEQSERLHGSLWAEAVKVSRHPDRDSEMVSVFIESLNQVIDLHSKRVTAGLRARVPPTIWAALVFMSIVAMASMGYHAGITGSSRSVVGLGTVLCFAVTMWLIADLDRPGEGLLHVNPQAMFDLREMMNRELP